MRNIFFLIALLVSSVESKELVSDKPQHKVNAQYIEVGVVTTAQTDDPRIQYIWIWSSYELRCAHEPSIFTHEQVSSNFQNPNSDKGFKASMELNNYCPEYSF